MLEIDVLTVEALYPAIVLGARVPFVDLALRDVVAPSNVLAVEHQCGGLACHQTAFVGLVLPLRQNVARAKNADALWPLFDALGDQNRRPGALQRIEPRFVQLFTDGDPYAPHILRDLDAFVQSRWPLPAFAAGEEALIEFEEVKLAETFSEWNCLALERSPDCSELPDAALVTAGASYSRVGNGIEAVAGVVETLAKSWKAGLLPSRRYPGRSALADTRPRAFLIWQNSD